MGPGHESGQIVRFVKTDRELGREQGHRPVEPPQATGWSGRRCPDQVRLTDRHPNGRPWRPSARPAGKGPGRVKRLRSDTLPEG